MVLEHAQLPTFMNRSISEGVLLGGGGEIWNLPTDFLSACVWTNEGAEGGRARAPKARSPHDKGVWGSVVSSPSGVWGGAPAANAF